VLQRAGFFHFAESHRDPQGELAKAIEMASRFTEVAGSLIVLPEGFNLGREYGSGNTPGERPRLPAQRVLADLQTLAATHKAAFIVGIIEAESRHNSAYFIDTGPPRLMCHKITDDGSREYERCTANCDFENPLNHKENHQETQIGALLCADVIDNRRGQGAVPGAEDAYRRRECLRSRLLTPRRLLCVPAYMATCYQDPMLEEVALILANSRPGGKSFVKDRNGAIVGGPSDPRKNEVCLVELSRIIGHIDPA
jgi:hypothetical protein